MKSFFKYMFASFFGVILAGIIGFFLMLLIFAGMASKSEKPVELKSNTVLEITLEDVVYDMASKNPFEGFSPVSFSPEKALGLNEILSNIEKAKNDQNIKGIYLNVVSVPAGLSQLQEIRRALENFKESGKFIIAHSHIYTQKSYYLASVADRVYLAPEGSLDYRGLAANVMFLKKALNKLGIEAQILRGKNNKFKSAVEPFFLEKMSDANKEQTLVYLNSIWGQMNGAIAKDRKISVERLNNIADNYWVRDDASAVKYGLIDELKFEDQVIDEIKDSLGLKPSKKMNVVSLKKYFKAKPELAEKKKKEFTKDKIAVIYAQGQIGDGKGSIYEMGTENISEALRKARRDSSVKAVVFRVNSPGGSALTSELIYREAKLTAEAKPFVVSMGDYAASGGYYISCMADSIFAEATTLTGSIGVFGVLMAAPDLINNRMGLSFDGVKTNKFADFGGSGLPVPLLGALSDRKLTAEEHEIIQQSIQQVYDTFVGHVAEGRKMTYEEVDKIGQGRVWTGENAIEIGLVDRLGGLNDAIESAKNMAGLDNYRLIEYPVQKEFFEQFMEDLSGGVQARRMKSVLGENYMYYMNLEKALSYRGIQARMPYEVDIY